MSPYPELDALLSNVDVVQASEAEVDALLAGDSVEQFIRRHAIAEMIITRGARGATLLTPGQRIEVPARVVPVHFRVGAGDVFLATYLLLRTHGFAPPMAARHATDVCAAKIESGEVPKGLRPSGISP